MTLKEYLQQTGLNIAYLSLTSGLGYSTLYGYVAGTARPHQRNAERLEKVTGGKVTVMDLRGKDDRKKKVEPAN